MEGIRKYHDFLKHTHRSFVVSSYFLRLDTCINYVICSFLQKQSDVPYICEFAWIPKFRVPMKEPNHWSNKCRTLCCIIFTLIFPVVGCTVTCTCCARGVSLFRCYSCVYVFVCFQLILPFIILKADIKYASTLFWICEYRWILLTPSFQKKKKKKKRNRKRIFDIFPAQM